MHRDTRPIEHYPYSNYDLEPNFPVVKCSEPLEKWHQGFGLYSDLPDI